MSFLPGLTNWTKVFSAISTTVSGVSSLYTFIKSLFGSSSSKSESSSNSTAEVYSGANGIMKVTGEATQAALDTAIEGITEADEKRDSSIAALAAAGSLRDEHDIIADAVKDSRGGDS